ncbi:small ribosomal subunit protein mS39-like [Lineus longissimus]|uniref:small ribosomal subunit protein mS39-like n=1 Tax=Lineus longissimus TaxID=88925 RepID=UPI002B4F807E
MAAPMIFHAPKNYRFYSTIISRSFFVAAGRYSQTAASTANNNVTQIQVPKRIQRSPTSVLEALAGTVEKDPLGPHYRFIDDPALIPNDVGAKRSYSLAKASGKKAAQWIMNEYYYGFQKDTAEPSIPDFNPKHTAEKILKHSSGEEAVKWMLRCKLPRDAFEHYQKMKEEGTPLSSKTMMELLEQLCIYTNKNKPDRVFLEDDFYVREMNRTDRFKVQDTWGESAPGDLLFEDLPEKTPAAYRCLIRGMSKANHAEGCIELYGEMVDKNIPADLQTSIAVLQMIPILPEESDTRWGLIEKVLRDMKENGVEPNLGIFNTIMYGLGQFMARGRRSSAWTLQVLREMKGCGIEPSLGTWGSVISVFYSRDSSQANILGEIMDHLAGKEFTFQHPTDTQFFRIAMLKCCVNQKDLDLAYKIDALLNTGRNHLLLGDSYCEMIYYNQFFKLLCSVEELDKVMAIYDRCVPHVWSPNFPNFAELLKLLEVYDGYNYIPQIWSDLVAFDYVRREDLVEPLFQLMAKEKQEEKLQEIFHGIAMKHVENVKEAEEDARPRGRPLMLTGPTFGSLIQICLNSDRFDDAWGLFQMFSKKKASCLGIPSEESLKKLADVCIANKSTEEVMQIIGAISDMAYPCVPDLVAKAKSDLELTDSQQQHLTLMV